MKEADSTGGSQSLSDLVERRIREGDQQLEDAAERFWTDPNHNDLAKLFRRATDVRAVSERGVFLDIPGTDHRLHVVWLPDASDSVVLLEIVNLSFRSVSEAFDWSSESSAEDAAHFLADQLDRLGLLRGDFNPDRLLGSISETLLRLIRMRRGEGGPREIEYVAYLPNDGWAVTDSGLDALRPYDYFVHRSQLTDHHLVNHVSRKTWANEVEVSNAFSSASLFHRQEDEESPPAAKSAEDGPPSSAGGEGMDELGVLKPTVFIASSVESLPVASALQENLDFDSEPTVWTQDIFTPSESVLSSLMRTVGKHRYGVFVLTPDDVEMIRDARVPKARDNVIFELGVFVGRLGMRNCFLVVPRECGLKLPSDLSGIVTVDYNPNRSDDNLVASLGPAANKILRTLGVRIQGSQGATDDS